MRKLFILLAILVSTQCLMADDKPVNPGVTIRCNIIFPAERPSSDYHADVRIYTLPDTTLLATRCTYDCSNNRYTQRELPDGNQYLLRVHLKKNELETPREYSPSGTITFIKGDSKDCPGELCYERTFEIPKDFQSDLTEKLYYVPDEIRQMYNRTDGAPITLTEEHYQKMQGTYINIPICDLGSIPLTIK